VFGNFENCPLLPSPVKLHPLPPPPYRSNFGSMWKRVFNLSCRCDGPCPEPPSQPPPKVPKAAEEPQAAEEAMSAEEPKSAEEAKSAEVPKAAEEAKSAEVPKAAEEAQAAEEAMSAEEKKSAEEAKSAEVPKAAEEAKSAEVPKAAEEPQSAEEALHHHYVARGQVAISLMALSEGEKLAYGRLLNSSRIVSANHPYVLYIGKVRKHNIIIIMIASVTLTSIYENMEI
jgi:hypothetical protein